MGEKDRNMLIRIAEHYTSRDVHRAIFWPLPTIKRKLSDAMSLQHIVQLLLTFDSKPCGSNGKNIKISNEGQPRGFSSLGDRSFVLPTTMYNTYRSSMNTLSGQMRTKTLT